MSNLGDVIQQARQCFNRGEFRRAIALYEEIAAWARQEGETARELEALEGIPPALANAGEPESMLRAATNLLHRARELNNEKYQMRATIWLAAAISRIDLRGRWYELRPLLLDGLATARRLGDDHWEIYCLMRLGGYAVRVGEEEQGFAWLQEALNAIGPNTDAREFFRHNIYQSLSFLMRKRGNHIEAVRYAEMSLGAAKEDGNPNFIANIQLTLARAEQARGELDEAFRLVEEVLPQVQQMGWKGDEQWGEYLRGELLREMGHPEQAEPSARRALQLARERKVKEDEVECLLSLGRVLLALGRRDEARDALVQARRLAQERDYADHFEKAEELLSEMKPWMVK